MIIQSRKVWSLIILFLMGLSPLVAYAAPAKQQGKVEDKAGLKVIYSGLIAVAVPSNGTKPMFFWWDESDNSTIYWMKYGGLSESWFPPGQFKHILMIKDDQDYKGQFQKLLENTSLVQDEKRLDENITRLNNEEKQIDLTNEKVQTLGQLIKGLSVGLGDKNLEDIMDKINVLIKEVRSGPDSSTKDEILRGFTSIKEKITDFKDKNNSGYPKDDIVKLGNLIKEIQDLENDVAKKENDYVAKVKDNITKEKNDIIKITESHPINFKPNHPYYFPFNKGVWALDGPSNIESGDQTIGVQFTWQLVKVPDSKWTFLEGNVEIRNRLYFTSVQERVNNTLMNLTKAELKSDLIIKKWNWNFDSFYSLLNSGVSKSSALSIISTYMKPYLSLNIHFTAVRPTAKVFDSLNQMVNSEDLEDFEDLNIVQGTNGITMHLGEIENQDFEIERTKIVGHSEILPGLMLAKNSTIGGFFRFVPNATVTYPSTKPTESGQSKQVKVSGFFWPAGRQVKAFLVYPYFGNGILEHDPSIGVISPQIKPEAISAKVTVSGSTINVIPVGIQERPLIVPTLVPSTVLVGIVVATVVCVLAIALSRKNKIDIINEE